MSCRYRAAGLFVPGVVMCLFASFSHVLQPGDVQPSEASGLLSRIVCQAGASCQSFERRQLKAVGKARPVLHVRVCYLFAF